AVLAGGHMSAGSSTLLQQKAGESDQPLRWWPMVFSVFGLLIPNGLLMRGDATKVEWVFACIGAIAFIVLCGVAVIFWQRNRPFLWVVLLLEGLGAAYVPVVYSATIFFALAAHILPWAVRGDIRRTILYGTPLVVLVLAGY